MSRRRGVGSITSYKTKAGVRWRWQLRVPVEPENVDAGTKLAGQAGYATAKSADAGLQEARRKLLAHVRVTPRGAPTVGDFAASWLDGLRLEAWTIQGYRRIIRNHVVPRLGATRLDRLTASRLNAH